MYSLNYEIVNAVNNETKEQYKYMYIPKLRKKVYLTDSELLLIEIYNNNNKENNNDNIEEF